MQPQAAPLQTASELARLAREFGWHPSTHLSLSDGLWSAARPEAVSYPEHGNARCFAVEEESFWFSHRNRLIGDLARRHALGCLWDIGAGNGFVATGLRRAGIEVVAVEPGPVGARNCASRGVPTLCSSLESLHLPAASIPAVGLFDVLEHIEDPAPFLRECCRVTAPGGSLLISVPASPALWSTVDERAGHFRRYTRKTLIDQTSACGFEPVACRYAMASLVLPVWLLRVRPHLKRRRNPAAEGARPEWSHLAPPWRIASLLLRTVLEIERQVSRVLPLPAGTSIVAGFRKRATWAPGR